MCSWLSDYKMQKKILKYAEFIKMLSVIFMILCIQSIVNVSNINPIFVFLLIVEIVIEMFLIYQTNKRKKYYVLLSLWNAVILSTCILLIQCIKEIRFYATGLIVVSSLNILNAIYQRKQGIVR